MLRFMVFLALGFITAGCSLFDDEIEWMKMSVPADSVVISDSVALGQSIDFEVTGTVPDIAWKSSHFEIQQSNFDVWVRLRAKRNPKLCSHFIPRLIHVEGSFLPHSVGNYRFHFWQSDTTSLDTTAVVY